jgi:hypothetical protein
VYSGFAVGSALRLESRGIVSMLTCHIQKFIRALPSVSIPRRFSSVLASATS